MAFRENFLATNIPFNEGRFGLDGNGFVPREELLTSLREAIRSYLESSLQRVAETHENPSYHAELLYEVKDFEERVKLAGSVAKSEEQATKKTILDLAVAIQSHCDYLGPQLCGLRWAMERYVSETRVKSQLSMIEAAHRQTFEHGAKNFELKEYEAARECFRAVLAVDSGNCFAHQYLAFIGVHEDSPAEAVNRFEMAYKYAPDDRQRALALSHLARTQYVLARLDLAADLEKAATFAFQESAGLWYEYATYVSLLGDTVTGLKALTKAMQLDWVYWSLVAADPLFETFRPQLVSLMDGIRRSISQKTRAAMDRNAIVIDAARGAISAGYLSDVQNRMTEFEEKFAQNNIYYYRELLLDVQKLKDRYIGVAKETIRHKIGLRIRSLRGTDAHKQSRIDQLREPIERLREEQRQVRARFKPWEVGLRTYSMIWLVYILVTFALLWRLELSDLSAIPYLLSFVVPLFIPQVFNRIKRSMAVDKPVRQLERRIRLLEKKAKTAILQVEQEHAAEKAELEKELDELKHLRKMVAEVEQVDAGVVS